MFKAKECTIISWARNQDVQGVTLKENGDHMAVVAAVDEVHSDANDLSSDIDKVYYQLSPSLDNPVVLTGHIEQGIYIDLTLPELKAPELNQLLGFELARRIPYSVEELSWTYEMLEQHAENDSGKVAIRVYAVPTENWTRVISDLLLSGVKADAFIPTFMSSGKDDVCYLPSMNMNFAMSAADSSGLREFTPSNGLSADVPDFWKTLDMGPYQHKMNNTSFVPAVLCGIHYMANKPSIKNGMMKLPKEMKPQRLRGVSRTFFAALTVAALLVASMAWRVYQGNSSRMMALQDELEVVQQRTNRIKIKIRKMTALDTMIDLVNSEYPGEAEFLDHLAFLTEAIPNELRLSNFSMRNGVIDMAIVGDGNASAVVQKLKISKNYNGATASIMSKGGKKTVLVKLKLLGLDN